MRHLDFERTIRGDELNSEDRAHVLAAFIYRHNPEHISAAKLSSRPFGFTHANDADWLANTLFGAKKNGRLDRGVGECHSTPTWPFNPEFRKTSAA